MRTRIIVNPGAGSVDDVGDIVSALREHPSLDQPDVKLTRGPGDGARFATDAVREGYQQIVACGGDGTLSEVVNGVGPDQRNVAVGVIPMGTGNDFARSVGFPEDTRDALTLLGEAVSRPIDLVHVQSGTERFGINVSAGGFSGQVDEELTPEVKATWGPLAYLRSALSVLPDLQGYTTCIEVDGSAEHCVEALNIVVANGRTAAGGIAVAPEARLDDGLLDLVVVHMAALKQLAALAPRILLGKHLDHELVEFRRVTSVRLRSSPGMWFNVDGELIGKEPIAFEVVPRAMRFLTNPHTAPGLGIG